LALKRQEPPKSVANVAKAAATIVQDLENFFHPDWEQRRARMRQECAQFDANVYSVSTALQADGFRTLD
jgi:hypothetical protein